MKRGDIVLIKFPFTDLSCNKVRPALVISSNNYIQKGEDAIFVCISSAIKNPQSTDLLVEDMDPEFYKTGLKKHLLYEQIK